MKLNRMLRKGLDVVDAMAGIDKEKQIKAKIKRKEKEIRLKKLENKLKEMEEE